MRKSSRRSDQRIPPTGDVAARRCTPSTRGEYTQISCAGRGAGRKESWVGSSLIDNASQSCRYEFVRTAARTTSTSARRMRSSSRLATASMARPISASSRFARRRAPSSREGGIEPGVEQRDGEPHRFRVRGERVGQVRVGEAHPGLAQVLARARGRPRPRAPRARPGAPDGSARRSRSSPAHTPRKTSATRACTSGSASASPDATARRTSRSIAARRRERRSRTAVRRRRSRRGARAAASRRRARARSPIGRA